MEKKYKKLNWSKERKELFNRMSDWLEEIRKGEKTGFVWSMEQLLVFIEQEIDRAREDTEVDRIKWALRELPKLTEGKDFREDNWSVIVEKLKTKLTK